MWTTKDFDDLEIARTMSADVIHAVEEQKAADSLMSEAACREMGDRLAGYWYAAAETARTRREKSQTLLNKKYPTENRALVEG